MRFRCIGLAALAAIMTLAPAVWAGPYDEPPGREMERLRGAVKSYDGARSKVNACDNAMFREMLPFALALDEEELKKYFAAYRERHKEYAGLETAEEKLFTAFQETRDKLAGYARSKKEYKGIIDAPLGDAAGYLFDACLRLAKTSHAAESLRFTVGVLCEESDSILKDHFDVLCEKENYFEAAPPYAVSALIRDGGTESALASLQEILAPIQDGKKIAVYLKDSVGSFQTALQDCRAAAAGRFTYLGDLGEKWAGKGNLGKGLAAMSLIFGLANMGVDFANGDFLEACNKLANAGASGLQILAGATEAASHGSKIAAGSARLVPVAGMLAQGTSVVIGLKKFGDKKNPGAAVSALGSATGFIGCAMMATGVLVPAGVLFTTVGTIVSGFGDLLTEFWDRKEQRKEAGEILTKVLGLDGKTVSGLLAADPAMMRRMAGTAGLQAPDFKRLAAGYPLFLQADEGMYGEVLCSMFPALGYRSYKAAELIETVFDGFGKAEQTAFIQEINFRTFAAVYVEGDYGKVGRAWMTSGGEWLRRIEKAAWMHEKTRLGPVFQRLLEFCQSSQANQTSPDGFGATAIETLPTGEPDTTGNPAPEPTSTPTEDPPPAADPPPDDSGSESRDSASSRRTQMNKRWWLVPALSMALSVLSGLPASAQDPGDLEAFRQLQQITARPCSYTPELGQRVTDLVWHLAPKPRFRHQVATLLSLHEAWLDAVLNTHYLAGLPAEERDLPNFARVDRKLFRGGEPTEKGFRMLKEKGIRTIVNLRLEDPSEKALVQSLGLEYVYLPVRDTNRPSDEQIGRFIALLRDRGSGKVYVHCAAGVNRTGTMVALWRIETGMDPRDALAEAVRFGFREKNLACDRPASLIRTFKPLGESVRRP